MESPPPYAPDGDPTHADTARAAAPPPGPDDIRSAGLVAAALRQARRIVVALVGGTVLLVGIVLIVAPGPAFLVIPAGLAILAAEFTWARRWLARVRDGASRAFAQRTTSDDDA